MLEFIQRPAAAAQKARENSNCDQIIWQLSSRSRIRAGLIIHWVFFLHPGFVHDWQIERDSRRFPLRNGGNYHCQPGHQGDSCQWYALTKKKALELAPSNLFFSPNLLPAFSKLKRLRKLNLDSNNITEIKAFAFKGLSDMIEISVQNNPLRTLSSFAFAGMRNVSSLMLGHNHLSVIEGSAFAATEMIQMLILNNNPIKVTDFYYHLQFYPCLL